MFWQQDPLTKKKPNFNAANDKYFNNYFRQRTNYMFVQKKERRAQQSASLTFIYSFVIKLGFPLLHKKIQ